MQNNINVLKEKLDILINKKAPYEEIYSISREVDKLLVKYYVEESDSSILGKQKQS